jgi:putative chitinase
MKTSEALRVLGPKGSPKIIGELAKAEPILEEYEINTPLRLAHFWAQAAHECAGFKTMNEYWGPTKAQVGYEFRKDLGNVQPGDGYLFRGRGIFQLTGRANYKTIGDRLGLDLVGHPDLAANPEVALRIACEYWKTRKLNELADKNDIVKITKKINGGLNGIADRRALFTLAWKIWGDKPERPKPAKTMLTSKEGTAAVATGAASGLAAASEIADHANTASTFVDTISSAVQNPTFLVLLLIVILAAAIWYWRSQKLKEEGI